MKRFRLVAMIDKPYTARNLGLPEDATADDVYAAIHKDGAALFAERNGFLAGMEIRVMEREDD